MFRRRSQSRRSVVVKLNVLVAVIPIIPSSPLRPPADLTFELYYQATFQCCILPLRNPSPFPSRYIALQLHGPMHTTHESVLLVWTYHIALSPFEIPNTIPYGSHRISSIWRSTTNATGLTRQSTTTDKLDSRLACLRILSLLHTAARLRVNPNMTVLCFIHRHASPLWALQSVLCRCTQLLFRKRRRRQSPPPNLLWYHLSSYSLLLPLYPKSVRYHLSVTYA